MKAEVKKKGEDKDKNKTLIRISIRVKWEKCWIKVIIGLEKCRHKIFTNRFRLSV